MARSLLFYMETISIMLIVFAEVFLVYFHFVLKHDRRWLILIAKYNQALQEAVHEINTKKRRRKIPLEVQTNSNTKQLQVFLKI